MIRQICDTMLIISEYNTKYRHRRVVWTLPALRLSMTLRYFPSLFSCNFINYPTFLSFRSSCLLSSSTALTCFCGGLMLILLCILTSGSFSSNCDCCWEFENVLFELFVLTFSRFLNRALSFTFSAYRIASWGDILSRPFNWAISDCCLAIISSYSSHVLWLCVRRISYRYFQLQY